MAFKWHEGFAETLGQITPGAGFRLVPSGDGQAARKGNGTAGRQGLHEMAGWSPLFFLRPGRQGRALGRAQLGHHRPAGRDNIEGGATGCNEPEKSAFMEQQSVHCQEKLTCIDLKNTAQDYRISLREEQVLRAHP